MRLAAKSKGWIRESTRGRNHARPSLLDRPEKVPGEQWQNRGSCGPVLRCSFRKFRLGRAKCAEKPLQVSSITRRARLNWCMGINYCLRTLADATNTNNSMVNVGSLPLLWTQGGGRIATAWFLHKKQHAREWETSMLNKKARCLATLPQCMPQRLQRDKGELHCLAVFPTWGLIKRSFTLNDH